MSRLHVLTLILSLGLLACADSKPTSPPSTDAFGRALDSVLAPWNRSDSPGAALVVMKDGETLYRRGVGVASLDTGEPIDPASTFFDLGSISKQMTAYAVLLLEQRGLLSLDDDVRTHLSYFPDLGTPITIRRLLDHTSGLREYLDLADIHKQVDGPLHQQQVRDWLADQTGLNFRPGELHMYSNTGFLVAADLVEAVAGRPFHEFMAEEVFSPLGLEHTRVRRFGDGWELATGSYGPREGFSAFLQGKWIHAPVTWKTWGDGGMAATADDLARWVEHLRLGHGSSDIVKAMTTRGRSDAGESFDYGLGIRRSLIHGVEVVWHGGSGMAFFSWAGYLPEHGVTIALVENSFPGIGNRNERLLKPIFERLGILGKDTESPLSGPFDGYSGHFAEGTFRLRLDVRDGELMLVSPTRGLAPIKVLPDGRLLTPRSELFAELDHLGKATAIGFYYGAQRIVLPRYEPVDPGAVDFDALVGEYRIPELNSTAVITASDQKLTIALGGHTQSYVPTQANRFHVERGSASSISFTKDDQGRLDGARLNLIRSRHIRMEKIQ